MSLSLKAKVSSNEPVGPEIYLLSLEAPAIADAARPGQFVMLRVSPGPEPLLARPFSIHGADGGKLLILYQVKGKGTKLLTQACPGSELLTWGPLGRGFDLTAERPLLVAGGMGVAPIAFAIEYLCNKFDEVRLLCGVAGTVRHEALIKLFAGRLGSARVKIRYSSEDGSIGRKGLVTDLLKEHFSTSQPLKPDTVLACGPLPMLKAVALLCAEFEVACQTSLEAPMACGVGACLGCAIPAAGGGYLRACQEGPVMEASLVDWEKI
ncbi:MAG: dihydroorotate dehydrogenase electron transfer subunit [Proteobacteria bacterium]|nr:dihydroorotate dehydrogenase electron transfer subunit [Pseudomonadota bacterium]MBU4384887.1 dihydroorotate dehydrogenase electron transfer subunit [Pseudomonadota bacterium]MCG2763813.1 dihydroorotate dehydrogenase electron transfer subunit [Desulfarculaceae bacterium]